ncbi:hypothetical protein QVD17_26292 [Tagetes erecta]|uniref:Uncharacterized protein n=1 Tax=Tagetes erecta TaxID=13708 RepID=A0AAD8NPZ1_TARER|nr:hypothetical protein QVD17_26292 [Tagetes erecta]
MFDLNSFRDPRESKLLSSLSTIPENHACLAYKASTNAFLLIARARQQSPPTLNRKHEYKYHHRHVAYSTHHIYPNLPLDTIKRFTATIQSIISRSNIIIWKS